MRNIKIIEIEELVLTYTSVIIKIMIIVLTKGLSIFESMLTFLRNVENFL